MAENSILARWFIMKDYNYNENREEQSAREIGKKFAELGLALLWQMKNTQGQKNELKSQKKI